MAVTTHRGPEMPDAAVRDTVNRRLDAIEREEGVRVLFACESGSRAWGFASPDSDYDVRFVYAHPRDWYLSIGDQRDVIERPIVDLYDVNGWDLRKALRLFRKSNPPMLEWLGSPIVYRERTAAAASLRRIAARSFSPRACAFHYLRTWREATTASTCGPTRYPLQEIPVRPAPAAGRPVDRAESGNRSDRVPSPGRRDGRRPATPRGDRRPARKEAAHPGTRPRPANRSDRRVHRSGARPARVRLRYRRRAAARAGGTGRAVPDRAAGSVARDPRTLTRVCDSSKEDTEIVSNRRPSITVSSRSTPGSQRGRVSRLPRTPGDGRGTARLGGARR